MTRKGHPIKLQSRLYKAFSKSGSEKPSSRELVFYAATHEERPHSVMTEARDERVVLTFKYHPAQHPSAPPQGGWGPCLGQGGRQPTRAGKHATSSEATLQ